MSKNIKKQTPRSTKKSTNISAGFEPTKVSLAVASVAATSLVLLTIVAVTTIK